VREFKLSGKLVNRDGELAKNGFSRFWKSFDHAVGQFFDRVLFGRTAPQVAAQGIFSAFRSEHDSTVAMDDQNGLSVVEIEVLSSGPHSGGGDQDRR